MAVFCNPIPYTRKKTLYNLTKQFRQVCWLRGVIATSLNGSLQQPTPLLLPAVSPPSCADRGLYYTFYIVIGHNRICVVIIIEVA